MVGNLEAHWRTNPFCVGDAGRAEEWWDGACHPLLSPRPLGPVASCPRWAIGFQAIPSGGQLFPSCCRPVPQRDSGISWVAKSWPLSRHPILAEWPVLLGLIGAGVRTRLHRWARGKSCWPCLVGVCSYCWDMMVLVMGEVDEGKGDDDDDEEGIDGRGVIAVITVNTARRSRDGGAVTADTKQVSCFGLTLGCLVFSTPSTLSGPIVSAGERV